MDAQEARILSFAGYLVYFSNVTTLVTAIGYALYFPVFVQSMQILYDRIRRNNPSRFLFALTVVLFISTTIHLASNMAINLKLAQWTNEGTRSTPVDVKMDLSNAATTLSSTVAFYSGRVNIAFVDAIVVWRAYVLWPHSVLVRGALSGSLIVTIVYSLVIMVLTSTPEQFGISTVLINSLNVVRDALGLGVNISATVAIAIKGWRFEKNSSVLGPKRPKTAKILAILVEGGVVLAILQVLIIALGIATASTLDITDPAYISFSAITEFLIAGSAIYPSLITVLVSRTQDAPTDQLSGNSIVFAHTSGLGSTHPSTNRAIAIASQPTRSISISLPTNTNTDTDIQEREKGLAGNKF